MAHPSLQRPPQSVAAPAFSPGQLDTLKSIALAAMAIDHVNATIFHYAHTWMLWVGRLAFPLFAIVFAWNMVHHLRDHRRFLRLTLLWGALAQWPFHALFSHQDINPYCLNILFVFLFAWLIHRLSNTRHAHFAGILFVISGMLVTWNSYSFFGLGLVLCAAAWFRHGGGLYAAGSLALLFCVMPAYAFMVPVVVAVLLMFSSWSPIQGSAERFLPRNWLYVLYAAHLWLIYAFVQAMPKLVH